MDFLKFHSFRIVCSSCRLISEILLALVHVLLVGLQTCGYFKGTANIEGI
jgi:hypothetical protein